MDGRAQCSYSRPSIRTIFYHSKVTLHPYGHFPPKVSLEYHINQESHLPVFHPKPASLHTLDIRRALAFYLDRTIFWVSPGLSFAEMMKGQPISTQRLSDWVLDCILTYYESAGMQLLHKVTAHSSRADICRIGTWSSIHIFTKHYAILPASRNVATCGDTVLQTVLDLSPQHPLPWWVTAWESPIVEDF